MRGKRTDAETKARIIEAKLNDPDKSTRDIEKELGNVDHWTVANVLNKDYRQVSTQSDRIASLIDRNNRLQSLADALIAEMIEAKDKSITVAQLTSLRDSTFKQNQVAEIQWGSEKETSIVIQI